MQWAPPHGRLSIGALARGSLSRHQAGSQALHILSNLLEQPSSNLGCEMSFCLKESFSPHIYVVLEIRIGTNCDCGQKNVKRQFFAIFESGNLNIHSNTDSNILFFAIFEYGKIVFRNSITLPVSPIRQK